MESLGRAISIILADDEPDTLEYLGIVMSLEGFHVVGTAADAAGVVHLAERTQPDVAVLDLRMPGGGLEAARLIGSVSPDTHIVVFSGDVIAPGILPLLSAGIDGYVLKGTPPERLVEAIRGAVEGGAYLAPEVSKVAICELATRLHAEERALGHRDRLRDRIVDVIASARFQIVHQPIIDLRTGVTHGVEALTRFTAISQQPPDVWFAEADEVGMGTSLELATAEAALRALDDLRPDLSISVNISPATALSGRLGEILLGADLDRVVLEVTEHSPVTDYPALTAALAPWRERGARLAVDDAGGGYASFAHILNLSPEFIKLDISLIRDIHVDPRRQALARAITGFATELGVAVVAEGIETAAEFEVIAGLGTPLGQGFHLGHPRPLEDQPELLRNQHGASRTALGLVAQIDLRADERPSREHQSPWLRPATADADGPDATASVRRTS